MNIYSLLLVALSLSQTQSSHQHKQHEKHPSCNAINKIVYDATNKKCSIFMPDKEKCFTQYEDVLYTSPVVDQINVFSDDCKKELTALYPAMIHAQLTRNRAEIDCNRLDLDFYDVYFCEHSQQDIKNLEKHLNQR